MGYRPPPHWIAIGIHRGKGKWGGEGGAKREGGPSGKGIPPNCPFLGPSGFGGYEVGSYASGAHPAICRSPDFKETRTPP
jgi:hypothetical protein